MKGLGVGALALIALAAIVLIGGSVVDKFGYTLRTPTTANASTSNVATVLYQERVAVGATGTYPFLQDLDGCVNGSDAGTALASTNYLVYEGSSAGGSVYLTALNWNNTAINCSEVDYLAASTGSNTANTFITALALFGTFAAVLILALIGKTLVGMWKGGKREEY